jgi:adenylate cyclase
MIKILVVDDEEDLEALIKQKFRQKIREKEYDPSFANNGRHALEILAEDGDISVVLSDINMPEMDGLTLLTNINEKYPLIKAVIVSAYGDMENIRVAMNRGAFDFITKPIDFEDLSLTVKKTIDQVEQIRNSIQALKENNILKMYVDVNVLKFMDSKEFESTILLSENIEATVIFMDICGFTSISEKAKPAIIIDLLNKYFDLMVKEIIHNNGIVDKFMGDCVMAVFKGDYHMDRAIECCLKVRDRIASLNDKLTDLGDFIPQVSIGINAGPMVSGNIGSSTLRRLDFTVIGDVVNTAQRLQSNAKANQILISEAVFNEVKQSFKCESIGEIELKNKREKLNAYMVIE